MSTLGGYYKRNPTVQKDESQSYPQTSNTAAKGDRLPIRGRQTVTEGSGNSPITDYPGMMVGFPQMATARPAYQGSAYTPPARTPDKEDWNNRDEKTDNSTAAYEYAHSQDEEQRDTSGADLGPSRGIGPSATYGLS